MDVRIQKRSGFTVAGVRLEGTDSASRPEAWDQLYARHRHERLASLGNAQGYGMCLDVENDNKINTWPATTSATPSGHGS